MQPQQILIIGVGNPLMRDEGAGVRTVELLMSGYEFPEHVTVMDAGTMGLTILDVLRGVERLIVVDAIQNSGHAPGTVVLMTPEDMAENQVMHSLHDVRIVDVLAHAAMMGHTPRTSVVGIQIERIEEWVLELSVPVEEALPVAAGAVLELLAEDGVTPTPRDSSDADARIIEALRTYEAMPETTPAGQDRPADA